MATIAMVNIEKENAVGNYRNVSVNAVLNVSAQEPGEAIYQELSSSTMKADNIYAANNEYASAEFAATNISCAKKAEENKISSINDKKFICILVSLVIVILAATACFVVVFLGVTSLKSASNTSLEEEISIYRDQNSQELSALQNDLHQLMEHTNNSISSLKEKVTQQVLQLNNTLLEINLQPLNISSLDERLTEQVLLLNDILDITLFNLMTPFQLVISSCATLPHYFPSGYYTVGSFFSFSSAIVYCDMTRSCGGVTGGWMRVAELDMTNSRAHCPVGFTQHSDFNIRTCVRTSDSAGCSSVTYYYAPITNYSRVCGRITAYQVGTTNAFRYFSLNDINSTYVDGVSLTHGNPRQHIWTFAAALDKTGSSVNSVDSYCPCQTTPPINLPPFVGTDYFCDAGNEQYMDGEFGFQTEPLWDGAGCPCCAHPPWFYKQLPQPTTDNIEMRVCRDEVRSNEDIAIQVVEIYVQ